jgi:hypothetical protein
MHQPPGMEVKSGIDRRKHEVDVLEHVMKGLHAERAGAPHVVDHGVRPWAGGVVSSTVHVQVIDEEPEER